MFIYIYVLVSRAGIFRPTSRFRLHLIETFAYFFLLVVFTRMANSNRPKLLTAIANKQNEFSVKIIRSVFP